MMCGPDIIARRNKVFDLHLFEFPTAENEIPGRHFVAKGLANLRNAKWHTNTRAVHNILKVYKDPLGSPKQRVSLNQVVQGDKRCVDIVDNGFQTSTQSNLLWHRALQ